VRKNRNGPVGETEVFFDKEVQRFTELKGKESDGTY
jgi:replicative DNA helicase